MLEKINELNKLNNEYIKEKQIIEQKLNKKEQELDEKEQKLQNNTGEINDLKLQNKLLKEGLDYEKKSSKLKENDELKNKIEKLEEVEIQRPNIFDKSSSTLPKIFQDVRKRDDKARTFAPSDNNDEIDKKNKIFSRKSLGFN